jgi:tetratricopeptide (TPR) repeat protein
VVYAVQNGNQYVYLYRHKPPYRVESLPAEPPPVSDRLVRRAPSWLLSARYQVVPFYGRDAELAWLQGWRDSPMGGLSVRLVHASSGQGKTRLATQFAEVCTQQGWTVAVVRHRSDAATASGTDQQLAVNHRGLVLIVDYAERWPLLDMLTLLHQHQAAASTPVRALLLARSAGGWWQSLVHQLGNANLDDVGQWELAPLAKHPPDRQAIYAAARDRFASILALSAATADPDLSGPQFEMVLAAHMKALVDVDATARGLTPPSGRDQAGLSSYLLDREHDYWRAAHQQGEGPVRTSEVGMSRTVYTATLTRALPHRDGVTALTRANISEATTQPIDQVLTDHTVLYPPADPGTVLEPLYPDRLGEDFLALTTAGQADTDDSRIEPWATTLPAQLLITDDADDPPPTYARAAITVLIEAAHRWPHLADRQLYPILRQRPRLALTAGGTALARLAELQHPGILEVLQVIEPHLPAAQHVDLDTGIAALTTRLATYRLATTTDPAERARVHTVHGWRLNLAGQYNLALDATTEAMQACGVILGGDLKLITPDLVSIFAQALDNQCIALSNLGHRQEALDAAFRAVATRRLLANAVPTAFDPNLNRDLVRSLITLSAMLINLGRLQQALDVLVEAHEISRRLAAADLEAPDVDIARTLTNLSLTLLDLGRRQDALDPASRAVSILRQSVTANPARFEPELAAALSNLGIAQGGQDGLTAIAEAIKIWRRLATTNPAKFEPDLARGLHNLGKIQAELGRPLEALANTTEAAEIRRRLAQANPAKFGPDLVNTLNARAEQLSAVGSQDASHARAEAIITGLRLSAAHPDAFTVARQHLITAINATKTEPDLDDPPTSKARSGINTDPPPAETSFLVSMVWDLPGRDGLLTSGKTLAGKVRRGMVLQDDAGRKTRILALEFLSPRDVATGEVTILVERTHPSPVRPQALLTATAGRSVER